MASPYGKDYEIYAYEFTDHHAYVGLTFLPRARDAMHKARGPVAEHAKVCQEFTRKVVSSGLTREEVPRAEQTLIEHYRKCGWTMLNKNTGGSTGSLRGRKWTREAVLAEALKFATKQAWIDGSQMSYRVAKREDWFDEASAHMPKRDPTSLIGRKVSAATRRKQGLAKQGKNLTEAHRAKISESLRRHWNPPVVKK
jgi:hypothetical protein